MPSAKCKGSGGRDARDGVVEKLRGMAGLRDLSTSVAGRLLERDDAVDALVGSLNARAASLGLPVGPAEDDRHEAAREGWIAVPAEGSLERPANG